MASVIENQINLASLSVGFLDLLKQLNGLICENLMERQALVVLNLLAHFC